MNVSTAVNPHAGVRAGRKRKTWRIKEWLSANGLGQRDIARAVGISESIVSRTISGGANNRRVLAALRDSGCPEKFLALPEKMKQEEVA